MKESILLLFPRPPKNFLNKFAFSQELGYAVILKSIINVQRVYFFKLLCTGCSRKGAKINGF